MSPTGEILFKNNKIKFVNWDFGKDSQENQPRDSN
jgi:hypothetical protein